MPVKAPAKSIGKVVHYYDKLGVAIVELASPLKVGDTVQFLRGEKEFTQEIDSLQIEHESVEKAKKGEFVGIKVSEPAKEGTVVLKA
jgi:putative protease|tara:strand:- start:372 stop:632 length:261 start_codon:yes stop_codon:yes gene_type:complete